MRVKHQLFIFFFFWLHILPISGQDDTLDWQEQILQQVDIEELGDEAYSELMEQLSELTVWSDTTAQPAHLRQQLVLSGNRCLSPRAGYLHSTEQQRQQGRAYLGGPWRTGVRYRMQYGPHWQAGFTLSKDAGEAWQSRFPAFDGWHAFVRMRNVRWGRHFRAYDAVVGHYRLRIGCGLTLSQGFSLGKQYSNQQLWQQRTNALTPHTSTNEAGYMQGLAADLRLGDHITLLPYVSLRQLDGTLTPEGILTALHTDGYHRTTQEAAHRKQAWQTTLGARLGWRGEWYDVGLHATYTQLQYDYQRQRNYYNLRYFRGHELLQYSADYTLRALGCQLRGEVALDDGGGLASLTALRTTWSDTWSASLLHRYYSNTYRQLHGHALAESSAMQGEQGATMLIEGQPWRHWQVQMMADWFHFSQPQYAIRDSSSQGLEALVRLGYSRRRCEASIDYKLKVKGDYLRHTVDGSLRLHPLPSLSLRTQLRARIYSKKENDPSYGYALSQSATWQCRHWRRFPFTLDAQAAYFCTDDYDSRLYLTERTVLYGFGLPMLYGQGVRYSTTATLAIGNRLHIDLKYALTNYANRSSIGSGLQEIRGNNQQDLWLQLRVKL